MILSGIDVLQARAFAPLDGQRVGLLSNPSAVNRQMQTTYQLLADAPQVDLVALFGAEHGAFGQVAAGDAVADGKDIQTGLPVYSLYGATYRPTRAMLADIDCFVCDIQDIGVRYYTYLWTLTHVLEACGEQGISVLVLDRPNPLGDHIAGCGLEAGMQSLVGRYDIPIQHGMTLGELLQMYNALWNPSPCDLQIIACEGYQRQMTWVETARPFIPTSPNMPHMTTVQHYSGACLIEGTTLSEGRGTSTPFEVVGAPAIDGQALADALNAQALPDVYYRPHQFVPCASKHKDAVCGGVQVHMMGEQFDALRTWLTVLATVRQRYPQQAAWLPPYREGDARFFDKLIGNTKVRQALDAGVPVSDIMADWRSGQQQFRAQRQAYLLYD